MSSDRCRDALSQCLPELIKHNIKNSFRWGYRDMADAIDKALEKRGFKIISIATYDRLSTCANELVQIRPYRSPR